MCDSQPQSQCCSSKVKCLLLQSYNLRLSYYNFCAHSEEFSSVTFPSLYMHMQEGTSSTVGTRDYGMSK